MIVVSASNSCLTQKWLVEEKSLDNGTGEGDHGKTAVYDFRFFAFGLGSFVHGGPALGFPSHFTGCTISVVHVEGSSLNRSHTEEDLKIGGKSDRAGGAEDIAVGVSITWEVDTGLLDDDSNNGKHANAAVLQLRPTSIVQVSLDIGPVVNQSINRHDTVW